MTYNSSIFSATNRSKFYSSDKPKQDTMSNFLLYLHSVQLACQPASQQCFSFTPNHHQSPASYRYFSFIINQHQPPATPKRTERCCASRWRRASALQATNQMSCGCASVGIFFGCLQQGLHEELREGCLHPTRGGSGRRTEGGGRSAPQRRAVVPRRGGAAEPGRGHVGDGSQEGRM